METIITMSLNVYLAIKTYQVNKQIQKETRLSGSTSQVEALKRKQHKLKHHINLLRHYWLFYLGIILLVCSS